MTHDINALPPPAVIMHFVSGIWAAQAVAAFAELGVADQLADSARSAKEIAAKVGANPDALHRLMRGVASVGVLAHEGGGKFALTPVGQCLRSNVPGSMRSMIVAETAPGHWLPWGHFTESVRTGKPMTEKALGMKAWDYYKANPEEANHFAEAMSGLSAMAMQVVLASYSFDGVKKVVDVGGSHGAFLSAVLAKVPAAQGVLFDLAAVVEGAGPTLDAAGVTARVERIAGSFFEAIPGGGDVYLLKHILHDWSDDECVKILANIARVMTTDGRVVVVEMPITDQGPPSPAPLLDLNMMVMLTGRERTGEEYGALFAKAGLKLAGVTPTPSPFAVLEARRA
ncbi:MAG: methyltransferase [Polyangiaceae bacterium]